MQRRWIDVLWLLGVGAACAVATLILIPLEEPPVGTPDPCLFVPREAPVAVMVYPPPPAPRVRWVWDQGYQGAIGPRALAPRPRTRPPFTDSRVAKPAFLP